MKSEKAKKVVEETSFRNNFYCNVPLGQSWTKIMHIYDIKTAIELAEQEAEERMREELTRWNDPQEPPQDQKHKLIKLNDCGYTLFTTGQWCPNSKRWWGAEIDENSKVIGWRDIHE